jgi:hypothetical protein
MNYITDLARSGQGTRSSFKRIEKHENAREGGLLVNRFSKDIRKSAEETEL